MQEVNINGTINASAEEVWSLAGNFGKQHTFAEAVSDCTADGSGVGAIRTLTLQDQPSMAW